MRPLLVCLVWMVLVGASRVEAQAATALSWVRLPGAEGCIPASELARAVRERLADADVFATPDRAQRLIEGRVAPRPAGGFEATLRVTDPDGAPLGVRTVVSDGPDCRRLDGPLVLVLAVAIDPQGQVGRGGAKAPPPRDPPDRETPDREASGEAALASLDDSLKALSPPETGSTSETAAGTPAEARPEPRPRQRPGAKDTPGREPPRDWRVRVGVRAAASAQLGVMPEAAPGAALGLVSDFRGDVRLVVEGRFVGQQLVTLGGIGAALRPVWLGVLVCPADHHRDGFAPVLCLTAAAGRLSVSGRRLTQDEEEVPYVYNSTRWLAEIGVRGGVRHRWGILALWAEVGLAAQLRRDTFLFRLREGDTLELHRPGAVDASVQLGLETTF